MKHMLKRLVTYPALVLILALSIPQYSLAQEEFLHRQDVQTFIDSLSQRHNIARTELEQLFKGVEIKQEIIEAISKPAEGKPWHQYRPIFVTDSRADEGAEFMRANRETLQRAEEKYGVDAAIITAIIGVESRYGKYRGKYRVIDALATLGFNYPRRGKFFRKELEHFILLSREESLDPFSLKGSYAGAMGKAQFISSSYREYAVDFDGDGIRDLLNNTADAIGSVASYLARHGWIRGELIAVPAKTDKSQKADKKTRKPKLTIEQWQKKGVVAEVPVNQDLKMALVSLKTQNGNQYWLGSKNFYAITRYNHSPLYAMAVYQLSQSIKNKL
ncbi:lytic murein transglycosylase B [Pseudomonadota bacterium]